MMQPVYESLEDAMDRAKIAIAYNSTSLVHAIIMDVPFITYEKSQYFPMSFKYGDKPVSKSKKDRTKYMSNLAYCQYKDDEFGTEKMLNHMQELVQIQTEE